MAESVFFDGGVSEAIQLSAVKKKPLVVFLKGVDADSGAIEEALLSDAFGSFLRGCLVLRLEDDLGDEEDERYVNGRKFRQFFPVTELPAVFMLGRDGTALVVLNGSVGKDELLVKLKTGFAAYMNSLVSENSSSQDGASSSTATRTEHAPQQTTAPPASSAPTADIGNTRNESDEAQKKEPAPARKKKKVKAEKPPPPVYTTAIIRFRLTNDETLEHEFPAEATLREVCSYVDVHRTDGGDPYVLEMMYPRRSLGKDQFNDTLKQLDLVPRSTVRLMSVATGNAITGAAAVRENDSGMFTSVCNTVGSVFGYLGSFSFFASTETNPPQTRETSEDTPQAPQTSELIPRHDDSGRVRRRNAWGENVYGLRDRDEHNQGPSDNSFWFLFPPTTSRIMRVVHKERKLNGIWWRVKQT